MLVLLTAVKCIVDDLPINFGDARRVYQFAAYALHLQFYTSNVDTTCANWRGHTQQADDSFLVASC